MARTKTTVQITPLVICQGKIGNKNILNRKLKNIKKKPTHTQSKVVEVKKNGRVIRRMNARRKSYYYSGKKGSGFKGYQVLN